MPSVETIEEPGEATRLHIVQDGGMFEVWLDTDIGCRDGLCIGLGLSRDQAIEDAASELAARVLNLAGGRTA